MAGFRQERVSDLLLSFLGQELEKLNDPRLGLITITDLEVSKDLKVAWVYWSLPMETEGEEAGREGLPSKQHQKNAAEALAGVEKLLKRRIAEELELRYVPALVFRYDDTPARGSRIDQLLKKAGF